MDVSEALPSHSSHVEVIFFIISAFMKTNCIPFTTNFFVIVKTFSYVYYMLSSHFLRNMLVLFFVQEECYDCSMESDVLLVTCLYTFINGKGLDFEKKEVNCYLMELSVRFKKKHSYCTRYACR